MARKGRRLRRRKVRNNQRKYMNGMGPFIKNTTQRLRLIFEQAIIVPTNIGATALVYPQLLISLNFPGLGLLDNGNGMAVAGPLSGTTNAYSSDLLLKFLPAVPLFDEYRVIGLKVHIMPLYNIVETGLGTGINSTSVMHFNDEDDMSLNAPATAANHYMNSGSWPQNFNYQGRRGIVFKFIQPKEKRHMFLNTSLIANSTFPTAATNVTFGSAPFPNPYSSMKLLFEGLNNPTTPFQIARVYIQWMVEFRGIPSLL